jgi:hypothetical protein
MAYAARTSREATETFRELEASAVAVSSKYAGLLELLGRDAFVDWYRQADTDPRLLEMVDAFLADAEPILETTDTLPISDQSVWLPREFENHYRGRYAPRDLQQLLAIAIKSAIQSRDAERFGDLVALLRRDGLRDLRQELLLDVVPPAMTVSMWSETDAERLDGLLDDLAAAQQP